jgi:hypothetical protein
MKPNDTSVQKMAAKEKVPTDTDDVPKYSRWDNFRLTLQVAGIALAILGALWGFEYWKAS